MALIDLVQLLRLTKYFFIVIQFSCCTPSTKDQAADVTFAPQDEQCAAAIGIKQTGRNRSYQKQKVATTTNKAAKCQSNGASSYHQTSIGHGTITFMQQRGQQQQEEDKKKGVKRSKKNPTDKKVVIKGGEQQQNLKKESN